MRPELISPRIGSWYKTSRHLLAQRRLLRACLTNIGSLAITFVRSDDLPRDRVSPDFVGERFGGVEACVLFVDAPPGEGILRQIDIHLSPTFVTEWLE